MRMVRRVVTLGIILILVMGLCVPAFAAYYPTISLRSRPTSVRRGSYMYHKYYVNSNSFGYSSGYRANFDVYLFRSSTGKRYAYHDVNFSGRGYVTCKTFVSRSWPKGSYKARVRGYYRYSAYNRWSYEGMFWWYFSVR